MEAVEIGCRVPRKLKKSYKKRWAKRMGDKFPTNRIRVEKKSISKTTWGDSREVVWGCVIHYKN